MNCAGDEFLRYFSTNKYFLENNKIIKISTYGPKVSNYEEILGAADIIVTQDVQNIPHYTYDYIVRHVKQSAVVYRFAFWRFDGMWTPSHEHYSGIFMHLPYELMRHQDIVSPDNYSEYYSRCLEKFSNLESNSDVKLVNLLDSPQYNQIYFSDNWHPTPAMFFYPASKVMVELGFKPPLATLASTGINRNRRRLVSSQFEGFSKYNQIPFFYWLDRYVSPTLYTNFVKYVTSELSLNAVTAVADLDLLWRDYLNCFAKTSEIQIRFEKTNYSDTDLVSFETRRLEFPDGEVAFSVEITGGLTSGNIDLAFYGLNCLNQYIRLDVELISKSGDKNFIFSLRNKNFTYERYKIETESKFENYVILYLNYKFSKHINE